MFKTIIKNETYELVEKKSKFITNLFYVETVEEAEEIIKKIKKKYYDARHNCYAYSIYNEGNIVNRYSDDGEPSGTAGAPMLNVITSQGLSNVLVIVTRYFGGILLGTGGLVKAYTNSCINVINESNIELRQNGLEVIIEIMYDNIEKLKYYLSQNKINIMKTEYLENIKVHIEISESKYYDIMNNRLKFDIINIVKIKKIYVKI